MKLIKSTILKSPYLGVYSFLNDDFCILPSTILQKEEAIFKKNINAKIIKTTINDSSLIGIYLTGVKNKLIVNEDSITPKELNILEKEGVKIEFVNDYNALGNIFAINKNIGVSSSFVKAETISKVNKFLKIDVIPKKIGTLDLPGANVYVNDYFFIANPRIKENEFKFLKDNFKVDGTSTTLNYGDSFIGKDVISNKDVLFVGNNTSNIELMKIDDMILDQKL